MKYVLLLLTWSAWICCTLNASHPVIVTPQVVHRTSAGEYQPQIRRSQPPAAHPSSNLHSAATDFIAFDISPGPSHHHTLTIPGQRSSHIDAEVYERAIHELNKNLSKAVTYAAHAETVWYVIENVFELMEAAGVLAVAISAKFSYPNLTFALSIAVIGAKIVKTFAEKRRKKKKNIYMSVIQNYERAMVPVSIP